MNKILGIAMVFGLIGLAGCGAGGGYESLPSINPASATVNINQSISFTVNTPSGPYVGGLAWNVDGTVGGNSTAGIISSGGVYTAPQTVPASNPVKVTATLQGTNSEGSPVTGSISAWVTIQNGSSPTPSATISVLPSTIAPGASATLSWSCANVEEGVYTINGSSTINGVAIGASGSVLVSPSETTLYSLSCKGTNGSASSETTLVVQAISPPTPITASISPSSSTIASGGSMQFVLTTNDTSGEGAIWTASFGTNPTPVQGSAFAVLYNGPTVQQETNVQIIATLVAYPSVSAVAIATILPPNISPPSGTPQVVIQPELITLAPDAQQTFVATVSGSGVTDTSVTWSIRASADVTALGTLTQSGPDTAVYVAPNVSSLSTIQIVATSVQFPDYAGYATVSTDLPIVFVR